MKTSKTAVHFVDKYLLAPTNPIVVNLIGAGGTGSQVITALGRTNESLLALRHPGLFVRLFDEDIVTRFNLGRQLFAKSELSMYKSVALINKVNRHFGTNWKAITENYSPNISERSWLSANLTITCVDKAETRFQIAETLTKLSYQTNAHDRPIYWMDYGNGQHTGQMLLSTVSAVEQPQSKKYKPVASLPLITEEFKELLAGVNDNDQPSCSMAEALGKQDLFINTSHCPFGSSLLWSMFREGMIKYRGFFLNLKEFRAQPIPIT
jgi:PRTRC genetic system ThiF family protein